MIDWREPQVFAKARPIVLEAMARLADSLRANPNVVGFAFGNRREAGDLTYTPALTVRVLKKLPTSMLPPAHRLPPYVDLHHQRVRVDVIETGPIYAATYSGLTRPALEGCSIGHYTVTGGTLGCLVTDLGNPGWLFLLSCSHVLTSAAGAFKGDEILQPGVGDGGVYLEDAIATLDRAASLQFDSSAQNTVDAAVASPWNFSTNQHDPSLVYDAMAGGQMSPPSSSQPAVGLSFAVACGESYHNYMGAIPGGALGVLGQLNVELTGGANAVTAPGIGMPVQKNGRTTTYTTGEITDTNGSLTVTYEDRGVATFFNQIVTTWMADRGDSGSVLCYGGSGAINPGYCSSQEVAGIGGGPCAASVLAGDLTDTPIAQDVSLIRQARDEYLARTLLGTYLITLFYTNEEYLLKRGRHTVVRREDQLFARQLYARYIGRFKLAVANPQRTDLRLTSADLHDARAAFNTAKRYLQQSEVRVGEAIMRLVERVAMDKTPPELIEVMNDKALYHEVRAALSKLTTIDTRV